MRPLLSSFALVALAAFASADTTIDNPTDGSYLSGSTSRSFSLGQSFTAPAGESLLTGFTLTAGGRGPADLGTFEVYAFSGNVLGELLYRSPSFAFDTPFVTRSFSPNVAVTPGSTYLALLTSAEGSELAISGQAYTGGGAYFRLGNDAPQFYTGDLAFRATFTGVQATPEPVTMTLGIAAFGMALKRRRRS